MPTQRRNRQNRRSSQRGGMFEFITKLFSPSGPSNESATPSNASDTTPESNVSATPESNVSATSNNIINPRRRNDTEVYTGAKNEDGKLLGGKSKKRRTNKKRSNKKRSNKKR
jgi:hypothetical protein